MSSCVVIQQNSNVFVASDTAISANIFNKRYRLKGSVNKVFRKNNDIVFCSGNLEVATKCKNHLEKVKKIDIEEMQNIASLFYKEGMFELFIVKNENDCIKSYQLSSYNGFKPIERIVEVGKTEIYALGFNTVSMLNTLETEIRTTDVLSAIQNTFNKNVCVEVGGSVDILYFHNGNLQEKSYKLKDDTIALPIIIKQSDCELVIADTLIGKAILSEELYISNGNSTFTILENGLTVRNNIDVDKVFLGLDSEGANPLFRLGNEADKCYFEWDNDKLNIKASKISIGSDDVVTNSKLEQTAGSIRLEVSNSVGQVSSKLEQTANSIRWEVNDSINKVNSNITQTADSIRAEVSNSVNGLNSKIDQTAGNIRWEVNNTIGGVNSRIDQVSNRISLAVNDIGGLRSEIQINRDNIASKVDANGVTSVVSQNPTCVQYGFNGISDNVTIDANGILIKHGNSYSRLDANGFNRWDGTTQRSYHYLQHMGQVDIASGQTVTITLPNEFKGKNFNVIVGIKRVRMAYDVYAKKYLLMGFYAEVSNIDTWNGKFSVYGSVRGVDSTNIKPNALIAGADYATEELRPVVAYWVYA